MTAKYELSKSELSKSDNAGSLIGHPNLLLKIITNSDQSKSLVLYDFDLVCGVAGKEYNTLNLFKYNHTKGIELLWDGNLGNYKYEYRNKKIYFTFSNWGVETQGDISNIVSDLEAQYKRIEPMSINEFLNGPISFILSDVGINDYDGDSSEEIITKHDIYNEKLGMYLSSMYTVWKIKNDKVCIYDSFIIDTHSFEANVMSQIIENGYLQKDKLPSLSGGNIG